MEDKAAARSFYATITLPVGLFSNVSANVTVIILSFSFIVPVLLLRDFENVKQENKDAESLLPRREDGQSGTASFQVRLPFPGQVISPSEQGHTPSTRDSVSSQSSVHVAGLVEDLWRPWC